MANIIGIKSLSFSFGTTSETNEEQSPIVTLLRQKTKQLRSLIAENFSKKSDPKGLQAPLLNQAMTASLEQNANRPKSLPQENDTSETSSNSGSNRSSNPFDENYDPNYVAPSIKSYPSTTSLNPFGEEPDTEFVAKRSSVNPFDDEDRVVVEQATQPKAATVKSSPVIAKSISDKLTGLEKECKEIEKEYFSQLTDISKMGLADPSFKLNQKGVQALVKIGKLKANLDALHNNLNLLEIKGEGEDHLNKCLLELDIGTLLPQMSEILDKGTLN